MRPSIATLIIPGSFALTSAGFAFHRTQQGNLPAASLVGVGRRSPCVAENTPLLVQRAPSSGLFLSRQQVDVESSSSETAAPANKYDPADDFHSDLLSPIGDPSLNEKERRLSVLESIGSLDQARDIMRDLDGRPLSTDYFARTMGIAHVEDYVCPEKDAFRGFMSNGCRVHLLPGGETAFYKRVAFEHLDHAQEKLKEAPFKLLRDAKSYQVVASFLTSKACQAMVDTTGVRIPKCYDAQLKPDFDNPMQSKFCFLLEDFAPSGGWYQQWLLTDTEECEAALSTYAKIHAFFWQGSSFWKDTEAGRELEEGVWESGSYVQPQAQSADQWRKVAKEWTTKRMKFEKQLSSFDYWENLGERLQSVAEECGHLAHPFANEELSKDYQKYRTFTHGDPKQANLFFRRPGDSKDIEVGLIDFQWSGFGLASTDIAHFITSAVHADMLVNGGEDRLLRYYFDELQKYLVKYGVCKSSEEASDHLTFETFLQQYETAVLDIVRLVVAYTWSRFEEPVEKGDIEACARTLNKTSYNKSLSNVVWLMSRCDAILKSRGV